MFGDLSVRFDKYPFVSFGDADRNAQVLDLLVEYSPIGTEEFAVKYEDRYGVPARIVQASFLAPFARYYLNGLFDVRGKELTSFQIEEIRQELPAAYYPLSEAKKVIKTVAPDFSVEDINDYLLSKIGFKRYKNSLYSAAYRDIDSFYKKLLTEKDIFCIDEIDTQISESSRFQKVMSDLVGQREIVEFDNGQYISIKRLEDTGITKGDLRTYCGRAAEAAGANGYFTVFLVNSKGAASDLDRFGFEDVFYESLLKTDGRFRYRKISNTLLFSNSEEDIPDYFEYFIEQQLGLDGCKDAYDLVTDIEAQYHISISISKLRDLIKDSSMYFDKITEKVYIDYDRYLEEV